MDLFTEEFAGVLAGVQRHGNFATSGTCDILAPGLEIDGVGVIALPVLPMQARELIANAEPAPYGRGEETLIDATVRRAWQIAPSRIRFRSRHWPATLTAIVTRAAEGLGVTDGVTAEFYKLLVYDEGGVFISHRDTEKISGMFATLVIVLPSDHSGGALLVRHKHREMRLDPKPADPSEVAYAGFYADCRHEVLPVTSGYRVTLTYNLLRPHKDGRPEPPCYESEHQRLAALLRRWPAGDGFPEKLIYPLEHAYTPAGLSFAALKGADAARASIVRSAAEDTECDLHLALLSIDETGSALPTGYGHYGRGRRDEDEEFEVGEIFDSDQHLSEWRRPDDSASEIGRMPFEDEEISPRAAREELVPDEESFHEATGNEGASFDRSYRSAALVLWPRRARSGVIGHGGLGVSLPYLAGLSRRWAADGADASSPLWREARELSGIIQAGWPMAPWSRRTGQSAQLLELLCRLGDAERIDGFVSAVLSRGILTKADCQPCADALALPSPRRAAQLVHSLIAGNAHAPDACAALLARLAPANLDLAEAARALVAAIPATPAAARVMVSLPMNSAPDSPDVCTGDSGDMDDQDGDDWASDENDVEFDEDRSGEAFAVERKVDADSVADLLSALSRIDPVLADAAADAVLAEGWRPVMDSVLVPAALALLSTPVSQSPAVRRLCAACIAHLDARISEPLAPPSDWTRSNRLTCNCPQCRGLADFLANPSLETWMFRAVQLDRSHVEQVIRTSQCDVDFHTLKRGSPHTLVGTKNQRSYEKRAQQREKDLQQRAELARGSG